MPVVSIDPNSVRASAADKQKSSSTSALPGIGFSDYVSAATGPAATAVAVKTNQYTPAAVIEAAMTGVAGTPNSFGANGSNAPYYSGAALGTASVPGGGYSYGGASFGGGYTSAGGSYGIGVSGTTGAPSQDYQEKQALFQQMNDANWQMLVAQVTVNDLSRDYQARSNILKSKSDTEKAIGQNFRG
jgi:hypothetical protein